MIWKGVWLKEYAAARIYGRRQRKRRAEKIKAYVESVMQREEE